MRQQSVSASAFAAKFPWVRIAPFDVPVVPDVYTRAAGVCALREVFGLGTITPAVGADSVSTSQHSVPAGKVLTCSTVVTTAFGSASLRMWRISRSRYRKL